MKKLLRLLFTFLLALHCISCGGGGSVVFNPPPPGGGNFAEQIVVVGHTDSTNFPLANALQGTLQGSGDGVIASVGLATGSSQRAFSTYFGGNAGEQIRDVFLNAQGEIYIVGRTASTNLSTTAGVVSVTFRGGAADCFIAKLSAAGQVLFATYLGGNGDDTCYSITVDSGGFIYVSGRTSGGTFPVSSGAFQTTYGGGPFDFFIAKLNPSASSILWATFVGGLADDSGRGRIVLDGSGNVLVAGETQSTNFPGQVGALRGDRDGALVKISADGSQLMFSRLIGGNEPTTGNIPDGAVGGLVMAGNGDTYVCGLTQAPDITTTGRTYAGGVDGYVARVSSIGTILSFTYLGGSSNDQCDGLDLDPQGRPVVLSTTNSSDFPTTAGVYQSTKSGGIDLGITKLSADLSSIVFSTFVGSGGNESGDTLRLEVDSSGNIFAVTHSGSSGFPTTTDAVQRNYGGGAADLLIIKLSANGSQLLYATYLGGSGDEVARSVRHRFN